MMGGKCATCLVPVLSSILICNLVTCESSIQRTDYKTGEVTVCRRINCDPDFYVEVCSENGTADRCEPCRSGTHLPDNTSSDLPTPCVTGTAIIPPPDPLSSLVTTWGPKVSSTPQKTGPGKGTVTTVTLTRDTPTHTGDFPTNTSDSATDTSDSGTTTNIAILVAGIGVGVLIPLLVVVVLVVICRRLKGKRKSRPNNGPDRNDMEFQDRTPPIDISNMALSSESLNGIGTREHNSAGMPQYHSETETTGRMGTGEATQNGLINTPLLYAIPSEEINSETEETEQKELVAEHNHKSYGGKKRIHHSLFNLSEQMSNNAAGSTIGLPSASTLDPNSITREDDYPDSIKLKRVASLSLNSFDKSIEVQ